MNKDLIEEYCNEGYLYLNEEKPLEMKQLDNYIKEQLIYVHNIYRGTDYKVWLNTDIGDIIKIDRVSSWTYDKNIAEIVYEGTDFVILTISNQEVYGLDIMDISIFKEEQEILLSSSTFKVINKIGKELTVTMIIT